MTEIEIGEWIPGEYGAGYWIKCSDGYGEVIKDKKKWGKYDGQEGFCKTLMAASLDELPELYNVRGGSREGETVGYVKESWFSKTSIHI